jgi:ribosome biogenesis protein BMS1
LRTWYSIQPRKFYNPVTSLLLSNKTSWAGMRLTGQVRYEDDLKPPLHINSAYKIVKRPPRKFNPLRVPKKLQACLPYDSKQKFMKAQRRETYLQKRAVVLEPKEKKTIALLQHMRALRKDQVARRRERKNERRTTHQKKVNKDVAKVTETAKKKRNNYISKQEAGKKEPERKRRKLM